MNRRGAIARPAVRTSIARLLAVFAAVGLGFASPAAPDGPAPTSAFADIGHETSPAVADVDLGPLPAPAAVGHRPDYVGSGRVPAPASAAIGHRPDQVGSGGVPAPEPGGIVGQLGGATMAVTVRGDLAYVGVGVRLQVISIADPARPQLLGQTAPLLGLVRDVALVGRLAFVADGGLSVVDLSDPFAPQVVGRLDGADEWHALAWSDAGLLVADDGNNEIRLHLIDVSDPTDPQITRTVSTDRRGLAGDVVMAGGVAYVVGGSAEPQYRSRGLFASGAVGGKPVTAVDVAQPERPRALGRLIAPGNEVVDLAVALPYGVAAHEGELTVLDLSDPAQPVARGSRYLRDDSYIVRADASNAYALTLSDPTAVTSTLHVVDIADPDRPQLVTTLPFTGYPFDADLSGDRLVIAAGPDGLVVVDIGTPHAPRIAGTTTPLGRPYRTELHGEQLLVLDDRALSVVDVSVPAHPRVRQRLTFERRLQDMAIGRDDVFVMLDDGSVVRLASDDGPTLQLAARHPAHPDASPGTVRHMAYAAGRIYITNVVADAAHPGWRAQLDVLDLRAEPVHWMPRLRFARCAGASAAALRAADTSFHVTALGDRAYVSAWSCGLWLVDVSDVSGPRHVATVALPEIAADGAHAHNVVLSADGGVLVSSHGGVSLIRTSPSGDATRDWGIGGLVDPPYEDRFGRPVDATSTALAVGVVRAPDHRATRSSVDVFELMPGGLLRSLGVQWVPGEAMDLRVDGDHVHAAAGMAGLLVLDREPAGDGPPADDRASTLYLPLVVKDG